MWNPLNAFFGISPLKRVLLVVFVMLCMTAGTTFYGIRQYLSALGQDELVGTGPRFGGEVISNAGNPAMARIGDFLESCRALDNVATETRTLLSGDFSGVASDSLRKLEPIIDRLGKQPLEDLMMFSLFDGSTESMPNLRGYRDRVRIIASYTLLMKGRDPAFDLIRPLAALQRQHLLVMGHPNLLTALVSQAGLSIEDGVLHALLSEDRIPADEAARLLELLEQTQRLRPTFRETMFAENLFIERAYYRLAARAPLGAWIMDSIFGDPLPQFRDLASRSEVITKSEIEERSRDFGLSTPRTHILVSLLFPNVVRAREKFLERQALHRILLAQLAVRAGVSRRFDDPMGSGAFKTSVVNGRTVFYSVGPNGNDDGMSGDDVFPGAPAH